MSEMIQNNKFRKEKLKELIKKLHNGAPFDEVKEEFDEHFGKVSATEIADLEKELILGGLPVAEIQKLCDVHAAVFKGSIEEIHTPQQSSESSHPISVFKRENQEILKILDGLSLTGGASPHGIKEAFTKLAEIDKHYLRKENLIFPVLERNGVTAPPKVMWGVDDEIRGMIKAVANADGKNPDELSASAQAAANKIRDMVSKEEDILFPMTEGMFTDEDWISVAEASGEIGYCFISSPPAYAAQASAAPPSENLPHNSDDIVFDAGSLSPNEANALLNTLPLDITFIDKNGTVKYFTQGKERIFVRPKTVIGRFVSNCHPPASVHVVEKVVDDLKSGRKDHEDFWIKMGDKYVFIRYYAVRSADGEYLGIAEVTQDIKPIQALTGEKRLISD